MPAGASSTLQSVQQRMDRRVVCSSTPWETWMCPVPRQNPHSPTPPIRIAASTAAMYSAERPMPSQVGQRWIPSNT